MRLTHPVSRACGLVAAVASLGVAVPSALSAAPYDPVGQVCAQVIGLSPGEKHYAACVQSLTRSLQGRQRGQDLTAARQDCLARGLPPGSARLAECELAAPAASASAGGPAGDTAVPGGSRSYFTVSKRTAFQRDQLACARLGFEPAGGGFDDCVADLRAALSEASTSMM